MMKRILTIVAGALFMTASVAAAQSSAPMGDMQGKHSMDGQVTKVDAKKGWIDVKTSEGSMKLHFPPSALQNVKKGDSVTVDLALKDNGPAASGKTK
jgi:Ni/Co efflux regulator RcnB